MNALRDDQALEVAPTGLTVVYGENGAGKSGYVRVLKQVCRARGGRDTLHPNVYAEEALPASAVVGFNVGGVDHEVKWSAGSAGPADLAQVSVFDSRSAAVYVTQENEVAYLPHGTDLIPKLVALVDEVRRALETELAKVDSSRDRFETIPAGTKAFHLLQGLHTAGARARLHALATLSNAECAQLEELRAEDRRYKVENPLGHAQERRRCVARLAAARARLEKAEAALDLSMIGSLREARQALSTARAAAELASGGAFADAPIQGVGSEAWRAMWQAARKFAEAGAVPAQPFPPTAGDGSRCVLCQQEMSVAAHDRMRHFEEFVQGQTKAELDCAARELEERIAALDALAPQNVADDHLIDEIKALDAELAGILVECTAELARRREDALKAARGTEPPADWAPLAYERRGACDRLEVLERRLVTEAVQFEAAVDPIARTNAELALQELEARAALDGLRARVFAAIEQHELAAKLRTCIRSANTSAITKRNSELLDQSVSRPLAEQFARQVEELGLTHLPISINSASGRKGKAFHALTLGTKVKSRVPTGEILSEGEHRCTALAAFFAEVSLQESAATVVFDDPVSSLDHGRRLYVARRLTEIAKSRPVLVFTHDLVFMWMLHEAADAQTLGLEPRYFRRDGVGAGLITHGWPWDGRNVKVRIGALKTTAQGFPKVAATDPEKYEVEVRAFYGKLRETWERAVEEVLFNGAVRRFSAEVQTLRLRNLHRVTEQQIQDFEAGMTKTSKWIQGHDHAAELAIPFPGPAEAAQDLAALEMWVTEIRKQHEAK